MKDIIVIKIGGKLLADEKTRKKLLKDILILNKKYSVVVVHGGKFQINKDLKSETKEKKPVFIKGLRYTDAGTLIQVTGTLARINKELVKEFNSLSKGKAVGICGADAGMILVERIKILGFVGKIKSADNRLLMLLLNNNLLPVVFPVCADDKTVLNVNADSVASAIAIGIKAKKLIFMSDVPGVLDKNNLVIPSIDSEKKEYLIKEDIITEGMIPKINSCFDAINECVKEIYITNVLLIKNKDYFPAGTCLSK